MRIETLHEMAIMSLPYDSQAPKRATNLSVNSDLLRQAKALGINLSATLEEALAQRLKTARAEQWRTENHEAISAYNEDVATHGSFGDTLRSF